MSDTNPVDEALKLPIADAIERLYSLDWHFKVEVSRAQQKVIDAQQEEARCRNTMERATRVRKRLEEMVA